jgi:hypothetical protein
MISSTKKFYGKGSWKKAEVKEKITHLPGFPIKLPQKRTTKRVVFFLHFLNQKENK